MRTAETGARVGVFKAFIPNLSHTIAADNSKWLCSTFKVLFVKTSSLGDVVHHLPAVSDAARELGHAEIDWLVEEPFAAIPAMHPAVRRVIPVKLRRWRTAWWRGATWSEIGAFREALREERYDAIIDTQSLLKSALLSRCALGVRHGMDAASAREALAARFYDRRHAVPRGLHAVERNRILAAAALGYPLAGAPDYGVDRVADEAAEERYAVFLSMTSRDDKLWPEASWSELGQALNMRVVLPWGSEPERARAARIAAALPEASVPLRMTVEQLARLCARAAVVVGVDTGLTHLAAAVGARTIGIYCGSDPALTGIYGAKHATNVGAPGRAPAPAEVLRALQ